MNLNNIITFISTGGTIWTNMPSALTEFLGSVNYRQKIDLTHYDNEAKCRLVGNVLVGGTNNAKIRVQYSVDNGANWNYFEANGLPQLTGLNTTGIKVSEWVLLPETAKTDVLLRVVGLDGNGTADPSFGTIQLQFNVLLH